MKSNWHCYIAVPYPFPRMVPTSCQGLEWQEMGMGMMMGVSQYIYGWDYLGSLPWLTLSAFAYGVSRRCKESGGGETYLINVHPLSCPAASSSAMIP